MLTPFGREIRKLRIDHNPPMKLKDLADEIGVSSAYLSSVETGAKTAAPGLVDKVADALKVDSETRRNLHRLASESAKVIQLDLTHGDAQAKDLAVTFARRFPSLNDEQVSELLRIIERDDNTSAKSEKPPNKRRK